MANNNNKRNNRRGGNNNRGNGGGNNSRNNFNSTSTKPNSGEQSTPVTKETTAITQYMRDVATVPFNKVAGIPFPMRSYAANGYYATKSLSLSGVMRITFAPCLGVANGDFTDPVNVAARSIYEFVRHANSGAKNYEPGDIMKYFLCSDSIFTLFAECSRAYRLARYYNAKNMFVPKQLFAALGIDFNDLVFNLANYRGNLNRLQQKMKTIMIPKVFRYPLEHIGLVSDVFKDRENERAQLYVFIPEFYWKYTIPTAAESAKGLATYLKPVYNPAVQSISGARKLGDMLTLLESLIDAVLTDSTFALIGGDVLKAYGSTETWEFAPVGEEEAIAPTYVYEMLKRIHNLTVVPGSVNSRDVTFASGTVSLDTQCIYENSNPAEPEKAGALVCLPQYNSTASNGWMTMFDQLLDTDLDDPGPDEVVELTRYKAAAAPTSTPSALSDTVTYQLFAAGTTVIRDLWIFCTSNQNWVDVLTPAYTWEQFNTQGAHASTTFLARMSHFDWAPFVPIIGGSLYNQSSGLQYISVAGDIDNLTTINPEQLDAIQRWRVVQIFNIPLGGVSTAK